MNHLVSSKSTKDTDKGTPADAALPLKIPPIPSWVDDCVVSYVPGTAIRRAQPARLTAAKSAMDNGCQPDFVDRWPPVLTLEQTARYLGIEFVESHIRGLIEKAGLPHLVLKPGGQTKMRIPRVALDEWISERTKRRGIG